MGTAPGQSVFESGSEISDQALTSTFIEGELKLATTPGSQRPWDTRVKYTLSDYKRLSPE